MSADEKADGEPTGPSAAGKSGETYRESGGVFIIGALLLIGLLIGVIVFWNNLLKGHNPASSPPNQRQPTGPPAKR